MNFKKLMLVGLLSASLLSSVPTFASEVLDNANVVSDDFKNTVQIANNNIQDIDTKLDLNVITINEETDDLQKTADDLLYSNGYSEDSILLVYNKKDNNVAISVGSNLDDTVVTSNMKQQMLSVDGINMIKDGDIEGGLDLLVRNIYSYLNISSLGTNRYDYASDRQKEQDALSKKEVDEGLSSRAVVLVGITSIFAVVLISVLLLLNNKNSYLSLAIFAKRRKALYESMLEDLDDVFSNKKVLENHGYYYLYKPYKQLNELSTYDSVLNNTLESFKKPIIDSLEKLNYSELETKNIERIAITVLDSKNDDYKKLVLNNLRKIVKSKPEYADVDPELFNVYTFQRTVERYDFSKEILDTMIFEENKEYKELMKNRQEIFKDISEEVIKKVSFNRNVEEFNFKIRSIGELISKNYGLENTLTDYEFRTKYENLIYKKSAELRIAYHKPNLQQPIIDYLYKNISLKDLTFSSEKVFERYLSKAKLLV